MHHCVAWRKHDLDRNLYAISGNYTWLATIVGPARSRGLTAQAGPTPLRPPSALARLRQEPDTRSLGGLLSPGLAACSGATNPCPSFVISGNSAATATFTVDSYALTTATAGNGAGSVFPDALGPSTTPRPILVVFPPRPAPTWPQSPVAAVPAPAPTQARCPILPARSRLLLLFSAIPGREQSRRPGLDELPGPTAPTALITTEP